MFKGTLKSFGSVATSQEGASMAGAGAYDYQMREAGFLGRRL